VRCKNETVYKIFADGLFRLLEWVFFVAASCTGGDVAAGSPTPGSSNKIGRYSDDPAGRPLNGDHPNG